MKIKYLLTHADEMGGTQRAVLASAASAAHRHEVEVVSVFRTRAEPFFAVPEGVSTRYLVDATDPASPRPARRPQAAEVCRVLAAQPSRYVEPPCDDAFHRLSDLELARALRGTDADVVVTSSPVLAALAVQFVPAGVVTVHQEHAADERRGLGAEPLLRHGPALDALVVGTDAARAWYADAFGASGPHLAVVPRSLPTGFRPRSARLNPVVAVAARLVPDKQVDHAIRAFGRLVDEHPEWTLRIYGEGPELPRLRTLVDELELNDNVHLLGAAPRMDEEWARASVCLLTSRAEAYPLVLAEARAAALPCVAYDCPDGPAALIRDGVDGFLVTPGDLDGLTAALGKLLADEALRNRLGDAALDAAGSPVADPAGAMWEELLGRLRSGAARPGAADAKADRVAEYEARTQGGDAVLTVPAAPGRRVAADLAHKAHEVRIEALHPGLRRGGGQVCLVADDLTPADVADRNLGLVVDVLEGAGIPYVYVDTPDDTAADDAVHRHTVVVAADRRADFLDALADAYADDAVYVAVVSPEGILTRTAVAGVLGAWGLVAAPDTVRVFQPVLTSGGLPRLAGAHGANVSFWRESEHGRDLELPVRTTIGQVLPAGAMTPVRRRVAGREVTTLAPFERARVGGFDFPVDVVYTWPGAAAETEATDAPGLPSSSKSLDSETLRYSLRSLDMYAPWVRTIHLVTDRPAPAWLDTGRVAVVRHGDLFPAPEWSSPPRGNPLAVETRLHQVPGLAEHFLHLTDDMFLGRETRPGRFFHANGITRHFAARDALPPTPVSADDPFEVRAAKNGRALLEARFGRTATQLYRRAPHALRRGVLREIERAFAAEVSGTGRAAERSHTDVAAATWLHPAYAYVTGQGVPGEIAHEHVDLGDRAQHRLLTRLLASRAYDAFCLADAASAVGDVPYAEQARIRRAFLAEYFPVASRFERGSARNLRTR
ncbi:stealth conserved region 3 domain-containing protein [Streptodolium elevatio]